MKIGIDTSIININQAGSGIYVNQLTNALQMNHEHHYALFSPSSTRDMSQPKTLRSRLGTIYRDVVWTHVLLPLKARHTKVDILHVPSPVMPLKAPCPTVISILDTTILQTPKKFPFWHRNYSRIFMPLSARNASMILTISEQSKRDIVDQLHVAPDKVVVTYLAASEKFRPIAASAIAEVKERYNLSTFILTVGTLEPRKNINRLLQAYASLQPTPYQLVHVGPKGWLYDDISNEVARLNLQNQARFLGRVPLDDLVALYNAASVFVYPSLYEGFGLPVLEAMCCGCPVITSNVSSLPEVLGDAGLLVDPSSVEAIANALRNVHADSNLADTMHSKGIARASLFSWQRCAEETIAVYKTAYQNIR
ncbi:MAG: glycosyltransferase family 1 protein [Chloroflexota bacterium]